MATSAAVVGSAAAVGAARPQLHSCPSATAVCVARRCRLLEPPFHLCGACRASPAPLRLLAVFQPPTAPVAKMTSTATAAAFTPGPHAAASAAAAPPSLSAIAIAAVRVLLEFARAAAERLGADLSAPWTAAVAGAGRCLELYREIMLVRCLLTWFPNVPWERQPFSAMRDLSDPFLRLFQRIVPPVFGNTLDISSLLAFTALGVLARIMSPPSPNAF